ncbi:glycosyltransferase involved in cell wall biosynthesis [Amorphus suaedae]
MNVLVLTTKVPFVSGGAEELRDHLVRNLRLAGVNAEAVSLPFTWEPAERLIDEMLVARSLRLANVDRVIALKFPAYLAMHSNKVVWLLHQYRQAYDLLDAGQSNIPDSERGRQIVEAIRSADTIGLGEARALFTNSPTTQQRLRHYNSIEGNVLRPPLNDPHIFAAAEPEGYIVATGRINDAKRQHLLVSALRHAPKVRLVVAGPPDSADDAAKLRSLAAELGVGDRLVLDLQFLSRGDLANWVNRSIAVAYLPFDEDSVGYCTMEAFQAGKPVLTTTDSGGVLDIVHDGVSGYVCAPTAEALGAGLSRLASDGAKAKEMGANARAILDREKLTWPATIEALLS